MTASPQTLKPHQLAELLKDGRAVLVDIREPDEFARGRIRGALSRPLSILESQGLGLTGDAPVVFTCRSGMRTRAHQARLAAALGGPAHLLEGGLDAWAAAGLPLDADAKAPLEVMRQVQISAGLLVLAGVILGVGVHPAWLGLSAFVGAGLTFAGVSGWCGMAKLLGSMPWNRAAKA
jgi:rhodanese-related sulfurtransferase